MNIALPLAHAGHWYQGALYLAPVLLVVAALWWSGAREKRAGVDDDDLGDE